ncbi:hypothetical protein C1I95_19280, partial [Micromonospora craterilacus]
MAAIRRAAPWWAAARCNRGHLPDPPRPSGRLCRSGPSGCLCRPGCLCPSGCLCRSGRLCRSG